MSTRGCFGDTVDEDDRVVIVSSCRSAELVDGAVSLARPGRAGQGCNTNSPFPPSPASTTVSGCSLMLLCLDPTAAAAELTAGELACPRRGCDGHLGPWGHARRRWMRIGPGHREAHQPRRARCRSCGRTHVPAWTRTHPRRVDAVETVGAALMASLTGLSDRAVADRVGVPATTVRDWLRRARANVEAVRVESTAALYMLDRDAGRLDPAGSPLADMLNALGAAASAWARRFGPVTDPPWQVALVITTGGILAPRPTRRWGLS